MLSIKMPQQVYEQLLLHLPKPTCSNCPYTVQEWSEGKPDSTAVQDPRVSIWCNVDEDNRKLINEFIVPWGHTFLFDTGYFCESHPLYSVIKAIAAVEYIDEDD